MYFVKRTNANIGVVLSQSKTNIFLLQKNRGWIKRNISGNKALLYLNIIRAEAHRDILINHFIK